LKQFGSYENSRRKGNGVIIMGAETKKLAQVSYVTDTDVSYYEIGEVEGAFQEEQLKDYIKRFGHEKLCSQLGYMQFQIWRAVREINGERDSQDWAKDLSENKFNPDDYECLAGVCPDLSDEDHCETCTLKRLKKL